MSDQSKAKDLGEEQLAQVKDEHVRMSLRLQQAFGLRREEAIKIQPRWADRGKHLHLKASWTKGGRERTVPIVNEHRWGWRYPLGAAPGSALTSMEVLGETELLMLERAFVSRAIPVVISLRRAQLPVETEVESITELREAIDAGADRIMLDNFDVEDLQRAVEFNQREGHPPADLEASGGITLNSIFAIAETGVDYISVGALTKDVRAIDLSMRFRYTL